jgi:hypothetical protein
MLEESIDVPLLQQPDLVVEKGPSCLLGVGHAGEI